MRLYTLLITEADGEDLERVSTTDFTCLKDLVEEIINGSFSPVDANADRVEEGVLKIAFESLSDSARVLKILADSSSDDPRYVVTDHCELIDKDEEEKPRPKKGKGVIASGDAERVRDFTDGHDVIDMGSTAAELLAAIRKARLRDGGRLEAAVKAVLKEMDSRQKDVDISGVISYMRDLKR